MTSDNNYLAQDTCPPAGEMTYHDLAIHWLCHAENAAINILRYAEDGCVNMRAEQQDRQWCDYALWEANICAQTPSTEMLI